MMEGRRRQKGENHRRSVQSRKPPRGSWQPTVPSWEKDFCRMVSSLDWETILQMKKFTHLYSNVLHWNDSAGEEAFYNAKKRYWAKINGLLCDIPSPDPDLYIDSINWDSETEHEFPQDIESKQLIPNTGEGHDPVVIFGDSLLLNHAYLPIGWGDDEEKNLDAPFNHSSPNYLMANQSFQPTGWGDCEEKLDIHMNHHSSVNYIDPWDQNWGNPLDNLATPVWTGYSDSAWQFSGLAPVGYMSWGGTDWNDGNWGWNYANNDGSHTIGLDIKDKRGEDQGFWNEGIAAPANAGGNILSHGYELGFWNESNIPLAKSNAGGNGLSHGDEQGFWDKCEVAPARANAGGNGLSHGNEYGSWDESNIAPAKANVIGNRLGYSAQRTPGNGRHRNHTNRNDNRGQQREHSAGAERTIPMKWDSMDSCNGGVGHNAKAAIAVGKTWNR